MKQKKDKEQKEREFERLVQEQRQTIYSVCYLFADDRQQADDLVQEVLIRLWQGIDSFEGRSSAKTWVYRVALNTCVTLDKRHRRRPDCMPLEMDIDLFADEETCPAASRLHKRIILISVGLILLIVVNVFFFLHQQYSFIFILIGLLIAIPITRKRVMQAKEQYNDLSEEIDELLKE
jgi:RNA polymerase sigma factor (sigma-70 family)